MYKKSEHTNLELFVNDCEATYSADKFETKKRTVEAALFLLEQDLVKPSWSMNNPSDIKSYARLKLGGLPYEVFGVFFFNAHHGLIAYESMFRGTLTQTSVYPREVVVQALHHNAAAVVFVHNHPSGNPQPSNSDESLTQALKAALRLVDVRVLDHLIVTPEKALSFSEIGLL
jgi:DNA repair protein RadC